MSKSQCLKEKKKSMLSLFIVYAEMFKVISTGRSGERLKTPGCPDTSN